MKGREAWLPQGVTNANSVSQQTIPTVHLFQTIPASFKDGVKDEQGTCFQVQMKRLIPWHATFKITRTSAGQFSIKPNYF